MNKVAALFLSILFWLPAAAAETDQFIAPGTQGLDIPDDPVQLDVTSRTIDLINGLMQKETGPIRVRLARDLGQCGPAALKYLLTDLSDADPLVRAEAARSIGNIAVDAPKYGLPRDVSALPRLQALISDPSPVVRREVVLAASRLGGDDYVTTALSDADEDVQIAALQSATRPSQGDVIAGRFDKYSARVQPRAADALGRIGVASHASVLLPLLKLDPMNRAAAIGAFGRMKATAMQDQVVAALADPHPTVRRAALAALGQFAAVALQQSSAIHALEDPDPTVRQSASTLLQAVPTPDALKSLTAQLPTDYVPLHDAARVAIVKVGAAAIPTGAQLLDDPSPRRREDGSFILGGLASNEKIQRHIALLADADFGVAEQAAKSMYQINPPAADAGPALIALINRSESAQEVPAGEAAILAAGRIRYAPIVERSLPLLPVPPRQASWPPHGWRLAGAWAIGMTAPPHSPGLAKLQAIITSQSQGGDMVFEAIKGMLNSNNTDAAPLLKNWQNDTNLNRSTRSRWLAHYGYDLFNKTHTDYVLPAPKLSTPDLTIIDTIGR